MFMHFCSNNGLCVYIHTNSFYSVMNKTTSNTNILQIQEQWKWKRVICADTTRHRSSYGTCLNQWIYLYRHIPNIHAHRIRHDIERIHNHTHIYNNLNRLTCLHYNNTLDKTQSTHKCTVTVNKNNRFMFQLNK